MNMVKIPNTGAAINDFLPAKGDDQRSNEKGAPESAPLSVGCGRDHSAAAGALARSRST